MIYSFIRGAFFLEEGWTCCCREECEDIHPNGNYLVIINPDRGDWSDMFNGLVFCKPGRGLYAVADFLQASLRSTFTPLMIDEDRMFDDATDAILSALDLPHIEGIPCTCGSDIPTHWEFCPLCFHNRQDPSIRASASCTTCERVVPQRKLYTIADLRYCVTCVKRCGACGLLQPIHALTDGFCSKCIKTIGTCSHCQSRAPIRDDGTDVCNPCYSTSGGRCTQCNTSKFPLGTGFVEGTIITRVCRTCAPSIVLPYAFKPAPQILGKGIRYGIELEIEVSDIPHNWGRREYRDVPAQDKRKMEEAINHYSAYSPNLVYLTDDGSLHWGIEVTTHPLSLEMWHHPIMDNLVPPHAMQNSPRCGCHIHISNKYFSGAFHRYKFMNFMGANVKWCGENIFGRSVDSDWGNRYFARVPKEKRVDAAKQKSGIAKYSMFRFTNHTLEIRAFNSTTDIQTIRMYVQFCDALFYYTQSCGGKTLINDFKAYVEKHRHLYPYLYKKMQAAPIVAPETPTLNGMIDTTRQGETTGTMPPLYWSIFNPATAITMHPGVAIPHPRPVQVAGTAINTSWMDIIREGETF